MVTQVLGSFGRNLVPMLLSSDTLSTTASLDSLTDSMVSGFSDLTSQMMGAIGKFLPFILMIVGGVVIIKFGISLFKKFGAAS